MFPQIIIISPVSGLAPVPSFPLVASLAYCLCPVSFWTRISKSFQTVVISGKCQHDTIQMEQISLNGTICQSVSDARAKSKLEPSQTHPEQEARRLSCSELQSHRSECGGEVVHELLSPPGASGFHLLRYWWGADILWIATSYQKTVTINQLLFAKR